MTIEVHPKPEDSHPDILPNQVDRTERLCGMERTTVGREWYLASGRPNEAAETPPYQVATNPAPLRNPDAVTFCDTKTLPESEREESNPDPTAPKRPTFAARMLAYLALLARLIGRPSLASPPYRRAVDALVTKPRKLSCSPFRI